MFLPGNLSDLASDLDSMVKQMVPDGLDWRDDTIDRSADHHPRRLK